MTTLISKSKPFGNAKAKLGGNHRKVFDDSAAAIDLLRQIYATEEFPQDFPTLIAGVGAVDVNATEETQDETGATVTVYADSIPPFADWPEEYRTAGIRICVSFLGIRGLDAGTDATGNKKLADGARGFVVYPLHPIDSIRAAEDGEDWLWKIVEKELSHVGVRGLRNVAPALGLDALSNAAKNMPLSVSDYVEESISEGTDTTAFDALWKEFRKRMSGSPHTAAMVPQLPAKAEVLRAIRSAQYARDEYNSLESIGAFRWMAESMIGIIDGFRAAAIEKGEEYALDPAEMKGWVAGRDSKVYPSPRKIETDLTTVDFSKFMATAPQIVPTLPTAAPAETGQAAS